MYVSWNPTRLYYDVFVSEICEHYKEGSVMTDLNTLLEAECRRLEGEQDNLQEQIRQGADQLALVRLRLEHVRALLVKEGVTESHDKDTQTSNGQVDNTTLNVCDLAVEILGERNGEPMYYKELAQEVIRRDGILNGATPWNTLTARMVQDERFVRPTAKGFYALRRDYPTARNVGARLKGGRRRSKVKSSHPGEVTQ